MFELDFPRLQYSRFTSVLHPFCELGSMMLLTRTLASRSGIVVFSELELLFSFQNKKKIYDLEYIVTNLSVRLWCLLTPPSNFLYCLETV